MWSHSSCKLDFTMITSVWNSMAHSHNCCTIIKRNTQCDMSEIKLLFPLCMQCETGLCVLANYLFLHAFTFMHLSDAFIQSDLHCIQVTVFTFLSALAFPGNRILALLAPCSTIWATGKLYMQYGHWNIKCYIWYQFIGYIYIIYLKVESMAASMILVL